jgi:DnaK suppressor protein
MNKSGMAPYKQQLLALRARLRDDVSRMVDAALTSVRSDDNGGLSRMPIHMADVAADYFETEFTVALTETKDETLNQIEEALERMEAGIYGTCSDCGKEIPRARLNAIPYATRCVKCATQLETH